MSVSGRRAWWQSAIKLLGGKTIPVAGLSGPRMLDATLAFPGGREAARLEGMRGAGDGAFLNAARLTASKLLFA